MAKQLEYPQENSEHRYLALFALTTQQLPDAPLDARSRTSMNTADEGDEALFAHLAAEPAAMEKFASQARASSSPKHSTMQGSGSARVRRTSRLMDWLVGSRMRYAVLVGIVAVGAIAIVILRSAQTPMSLRVQQAFAQVTFGAQSSASVVLPWERPKSIVGFAAIPSNDTPGAYAFARGLARARRRLEANAQFAQELERQGTHSSNGSSSESSDLENYVALGEWNLLLWATCVSDTSPARDFWRQQESLARRLARANYAKVERTGVTRHLETVTTLLDSVADGVEVKHNERRIADELLRFREAFAPHKLRPSSDSPP